MTRDMYAPLTDVEAEQIRKASENGDTTPIRTFSIFDVMFTHVGLYSFSAYDEYRNHYQIDWMGGEVTLTYKGRVKHHEGIHKASFGFIRDIIESIIKFSR